MTDGIDLAAFLEARWERSCQLSAAFFISYEHLLQIHDEIDLFWKKRWTFGKCVFLWSRYYSLFFNIGNAAVFLQDPATLHLCSRFFHWQNAGACLQIITTHIILYIRIYAMYKRSIQVLAFLILLLCAEVTVLAFLMARPSPNSVVTNNPSMGLYICADSDPEGKPWTAFYWTSAMAIDSILLIMALYVGWTYRHSGNNRSLMRVVTKDSVAYFVIIFLIYAANQAIWIINRLTLNELATGFSFSISAVLANRLMLSVRSRYYCSPTAARPSVPPLFTTVGPNEGQTRDALEEHGVTYTEEKIDGAGEDLSHCYASIELDNYNHEKGF